VRPADVNLGPEPLTEWEAENMGIRPAMAVSRTRRDGASANKRDMR
jgi:hypothetical protein